MKEYDRKVIREVFEEEGIGPFERDLMEELDRIEDRIIYKERFAR